MYPLILTVPSLIEKERCKYALKTLLDMDLAIFDELLAGHPEATNFSSAVAYCPLASLSLFSSSPSFVHHYPPFYHHSPLSLPSFFLCHLFCTILVSRSSCSRWMYRLTRQSDRKMQPDRPPAGLLVH